MNVVPIAGEDYIRCRVLGKGSFGKVYAMQHVSAGCYRVVKEMHKATVISKGKNMADLLLNERLLLSEVKGCPFVVKSFASFQDDKFLYMLLEFCSGGELQYHFEQATKFSEAVTRNYVAQITIALGHLHQKYHIVHRDLKPENILLDEKGYCALIDFNMAIKCDDNLVIKNPKHLVVGTLPYMAPEILEGNDHSHKVDWWSLGIIAFELVNGKRPYSSTGMEGLTEKKRLLAALHQTHLAEKWAAHVSEEFKSLVTGLLEKDPDKRFGYEEVKNHIFFKDLDWDGLLHKTIPPPILPNPNAVNFRPDANVEEVFGLSKPKESLNVPLNEEQQKVFEEWDWYAEDQEVPPPDPQYLEKINKKKKKKKKAPEDPKRNGEQKALETPPEIRKDTDLSVASNSNSAATTNAASLESSHTHTTSNTNTPSENRHKSAKEKKKEASETPRVKRRKPEGEDTKELKETKEAKETKGKEEKESKEEGEEKEEERKSNRKRRQNEGDVKRYSKKADQDLASSSPGEVRSSKRNNKKHTKQTTQELLQSTNED
uniref:Protein kinase domain-containing protein n=1 Tax=Arcella intermedia TaxID=1963864 RepID=A0A6B2L1B8_9EUKA